MTSKLKPLGLALMAAFALSAVAAAGAQAAPVLEAETPAELVTITGTELSTPAHPEHEFTTDTGAFTCNSELFEGTLEPNPDPSVTVTPTYKECVADLAGLGILPVTVTHNGCNYTIYGGGQTDLEGHHFDNGTVDIVCPEQKVIEVHVYENALAHANNNSICTFTVPGQVGLHTNTAENTTDPPVKDVDLISTISNIDVVAHGPDLTCGPLNQEATYNSATTVTGYEDEAHEQQVGLTVREG